MIIRSLPGQRIPRIWVLALLLLVLVIGIYARVANLANNPGWDADEGYNWSIAAHLAAGEGQMFALRYAFVQHPPAFYVLGALVIRAWTHDIVALRLVAALCGVLTGLALVPLGRVAMSGRAGTIAAAVYLIWPQAVLQSRWAYTYNLLALLVPLALLSACRAATNGDDQGRRSAAWIVAAGLCTGLALATDQEAIALVPAIGYLLWPEGARTLIQWLLAVVLIPAIYVIWMLVSRPADFLFDLQHTATRLDHDPFTLLQRVIHLVQFEPLLGLGLIGLLALPPARRRTMIWIATVILLVIVLAVRDPAPLFRAAIPVLPLAALGLGSLAERALAVLSRPARRRQTRRLTAREVSTSARRATPFQIASIAVVALALVMIDRDVQGAYNGFPTALSPVLPRSPADARQMARWVNTRTRATDLVIAMPTIAWLFTARTAEILQAVAITGEGTAFYAAGIAPQRFRYDTHLAAARFLVIDGYTRWAITQLPAERTLIDAAMRTWRVAYRRGEYVVYANPSEIAGG